MFRALGLTNCQSEKNMTNLLVTEVGRYLVAVAIVFAILFYIGSFGVTQSGVLAFILSAVILGIRNTDSKSLVRFTPYYVSVRPNWFNIMTDFKLVDKDKWEELQQWNKGIEFPEGHILRSGVFYVVTSQSVDGERMLIFRKHSFVSEIDWIEPFRPNGPFQKTQVENPPEWYPDFDFFMTSRSGGYHLGIRVPDGWWNEMKAFCPVPVDERFDCLCGRVNLTVAKIPFREFDIYWEKIEFDTKYNDRVWANVQSARMQNGWVEEEQPELEHDWGKTIKHKYFTVDHDAI